MKKIFFILVVFALSLSSCNDFLDIKPNNLIVGTTLTEENLPLLISPLYNLVWFDFNGQFYYGLGDGRSNNLSAPYSDYIYPFAHFTETGLTGPLVSAWGSFYVVIQQANKVIITINESNVSDEAKNLYIAEARFMRGIAYWYLASLWGDAIISEDPTPLTKNPVVNTNPRKDVYDFAIRDMEFAAKWLPETAPRAGRVDRYSAFGMLSRFYLHYSGLVASNYGENPNVGTRDAAYLELAKKAAEKVIKNGKYALMPNYPDLFKIENNNNSEVLFSFQWVPGLDSSTGNGYINTQQAYFAYGAAITGDDASWGGATVATYDVIEEFVRERADTIRRKATWMSYGDYYAELNKAEGGLLYEQNKPESEEASTTLHVKKGVTGSPKDNAAIGRMNSALNTPMQRLTEVYLNYAEAILGNNPSTTDPVALEYFNKVRERVKLNPKTSLIWEDFRHERRVEFCMEGQYWYDLVSRAYYKQSDVIAVLVNQNRQERPPFLFTAPNDLRLDSSREVGTSAVGAITPAVFLLPYPQSEVVKNPKLKEAPVPYTFNEDRITDLF
jgi:SusD family.